jgi:hypothetical protein
MTLSGTGEAVVVRLFSASGGGPGGRQGPYTKPHVAKAPNEIINAIALAPGKRRPTAPGGSRRQMRHLGAAGRIEAYVVGRSRGSK